MERARIIHQALRQAGFVADDTVTTHRAYVGTLEAGQTTVPVRLDLHDPDMLSPPGITLLSRVGPLAEPLPHVLGNSLCYLDRALAVLDPYDPLGMIGACLQKASQLLEDLLAGRYRDSAAREFPVMWEPERLVFTDLSGGPAPQPRMVRVRANDDFAVFFLADKEAALAELATNYFYVNGEPAWQAVRVLPVSAPLLARGPNWPPSNLPQFLEWLTAIDPAIGRDALAHISLQGGTERAIILQAPNALIGVAFEIPGKYDNQEFRTRPPAIQHALQADGASWPFTRLQSLRMDRSHIYSRSLGPEQPNLTVSNILLIGCGTIGGFLADLLSKVGAGNQGLLLLADSDMLLPENVGRHLLGMPDLLRNKATACRDYLQRQMGPLRIEAWPGDARTLSNRFADFDLIIDATGEEALSLWLNQRRIESIQAGASFPPILHAWLHGAGSAAVSFLNAWPAGACRKCLRPEADGPWVHNPLKDEPESGAIVVQACGDATHVRYPVSASVQAAGLALEMALDWRRAPGKSGLRSRQIDPDVARQNFNRLPNRSPRCPACGNPSSFPR